MKFRLLVMWENIKLFLGWFDFSECPKEAAGYRCQHRTYPNGTKECGEEHNYWQGDEL